MSRFLVINPVSAFGAASGGPAAPFAAFKLLEVLAPSLVRSNFAAVAGGLRLFDAKVDLILDANAASLGAMSNPLVDYPNQTGFGLLYAQDSSVGLSASLAIGVGHDPRYFPNLRPWFSIDRSDLILVQHTGLAPDGWIDAFGVAAHKPVQKLRMFFPTNRELERGFDEANTLAALWRDVLTIERASV